jgi:hypothetical protein
MASITTFMQWAINTVDGTLPATQLIDNVSGRIGAIQEIVDSTGQNASLTGRTNRMRVTGTPTEPAFNMEPTAQEWAYLLPWMLGGSNTGTTPIVYTIGNDLPLRGIQGVEDRAGSAYPHNYTNVAVDSFTIRSSPGQLLGLEINSIVSGGVYENSTAFPSLSNFDNTTSPFAFPDLTGDGATGSDGVFTIAGTGLQIFSSSISVSYNLDRARRPHTLQAAGLRKRARDVSLSFNMPAADAQAIYASDLRGLTPRAAIMRFRNPVASVEFIEFEFPSVIFPLPDLNLPARDEVRVDVTGMAKFNGTNSPMIVRLQVRT